jgi:polyphosphate kinase 2 (PPK2 family)
LIVRVHPELLDAQRIPNARDDSDFWDARYADINHFERHLTRNGTRVIKLFLHLSREEQRKRLLKRLKDPSKHWKFSPADLAERSRWDDYRKAYEHALSATSTAWAPWYIIPADHKWVTRAAVAALLAKSITELGLKYPEITPEQHAAIAEAKQRLEAE